MAEESKVTTLNKQSESKSEVVLSVSPGQLPNLADKTLNETNSRVADIVRIKELEGKETGLMSGIYYGVINRFNAALGITFDPAVFAEMTDTLNKHRHILEMNSSDNSDLETKKAA